MSISLWHSSGLRYLTLSFPDFRKFDINTGFPIFHFHCFRATLNMRRSNPNSLTIVAGFFPFERLNCSYPPTILSTSCNVAFSPKYSRKRFVIE